MFPCRHSLRSPAAQTKSLKNASPPTRVAGAAPARPRQVDVCLRLPGREPSARVLKISYRAPDKLIATGKSLHGFGAEPMACLLCRCMRSRSPVSTKAVATDPASFIKRLFQGGQAPVRGADHAKKVMAEEAQYVLQASSLQHVETTPSADARS